ncbi:MAG: ribulose-phosphate 3-epimerase [Muribaculaceae bacterium]|nr:ribulose-phosphate 3-epimerase [Muribaculaceae bacterium]
MLVSPSLLSANFAHLSDDIDMINSSEADMLHLDVMDGVFVPNISFGFPVIKLVKHICEKPLDAHMMIVEPHKWIPQMRDMGVRIMNVHQEACRHLHRTIYQIREAGMEAGVTINPATPVMMLQDIINDVDLVLIMSVNPGFGGQPFIEHSIDKVRELRALIDRTGSKAKIQVDGGVNAETGKRLAEAGADILVAGSYIFNAKDPHAAIKSLKVL